MHDIMILAQGVLQIFVLHVALRYNFFSQSRKRETIQKNINKILPNVNQVIYALNAICMPNIMILAQGVLQIFCSQRPLWVKYLSMKGGIIQSNIYKIL